MEYCGVNRYQKHKMKIYDVTAKSIVIYVSETWRMNESDRRRVKAVKMDALRAARKTQLNKIQNTAIREIMETIPQTIERLQIIWYGHIQRMVSDKLLKAVWE